MKQCLARVPRAPGAHDDRGSLAAHRRTKAAKLVIRIDGQLTPLCGTHLRQWVRRAHVEVWRGR